MMMMMITMMKRIFLKGVELYVYYDKQGGRHTIQIEIKTQTNPSASTKQHH